MSIQFILIFAATVFIASIIPGPSMLLALTHGMQHGAKKSMASAMGNVSVTLVQALVSIAGLGTVLMASETVFLVIKYAGAAYLIYMGITLLRAPYMVDPSNRERSYTTTGLTKKMYLQAAFVTAGNPKAIVFFTAVFPQFIHPGAGFAFQSFVLLSITSFIAFVCFMLYAISGQKILSLFSKTGIARMVKNLIGTGFIVAGIGLAFSRR